MKLVRELPKDKWSLFVARHPRGNIFQTPEMFDVYSATKKYEPTLLALKRNDEILGVLLSVIQKQYSGFMGMFTARSIIIGGPLVNDNIEENYDILIREYDNFIRNRVIYSQFRNLWKQDLEIDILKKNGFGYEEHLNILIDLTSNKEVLWKDLAKSRREGIRKAKRNELCFDVRNSKDVIPKFYTLLEMTYKNAKLPHPDLDFFYSLHRNISSDNLKFFTLRKNNKILIILAALIYNKCLYAFYIGTVSDNHYLKMRPVDLLYWEVMCWAKENGCKTYDWLGAGKPDKEYGVRKFKLQYGGDVIEMGRYLKIHRPLLMKTGKMGLRLWQKFN